MTEEKRVGDKLITKSFLLSKIEEEIKQAEQDLFKYEDLKSECRLRLKELHLEGYDTDSEECKTVRKNTDRYRRKITTLYNRIKKLRAGYKTYQNLDI